MIEKRPLYSKTDGLLEFISVVDRIKRIRVVEWKADMERVQRNGLHSRIHYNVTVIFGKATV
jgi:hypothetical protein